MLQFGGDPYFMVSVLHSNTGRRRRGIGNRHANAMQSSIKQSKKLFQKLSLSNPHNCFPIIFLNFNSRVNKLKVIFIIISLGIVFVSQRIKRKQDAI